MSSESPGLQQEPEIEGYEIKTLVGGGRVGNVFLAVQQSLDREVAIKVMSAPLASRPGFSERFLSEARLAASLSHPNIIPVFETGLVDQGQPYFSMPYLSQGDLKARIAQEISERDIFSILFQVVDALGHAHKQGVVHRDITPTSILFSATGSPLLGGFGEAWAITCSDEESDAAWPASIRYMSPELVRGEPADGRSDIYSLGIVIFEALAGQTPFTDEATSKNSHAHEEIELPDLPDEYSLWQPLLTCMLSRLPADRFQDCIALAEALVVLAKEALGDADLSHTEQLGHGSSTQVSSPVPRTATRVISTVAGPLAKSVDSANVTVANLKPVAIERSAGQSVVAPSASMAWKGRLSSPTFWVFLGVGLGSFLLLLLMIGADETSPPPSVPDSNRGLEVVDSKSSTVPGTVAMDPAPGDTPATEPPAAQVEDISQSQFDSPEPALDDILPLASAEQEIQIASVDLDNSESLVTENEQFTPFDVDAILALAEEDLKQRRLTTPSGRSALDRYRLVLQKFPKNAEAVAGLEQILDLYRRWMQQRLTSEDFKAAYQYMVKARQVVSASSGNLNSHGKALDDISASVYNMLLGKGKRALAAWNPARADKYYRGALFFKKKATKARSGLDKVSVLGKPGYRFSDVLKNGKNAPALSVLPTPGKALARMGLRRLAISRHEITVAEFEQFVAADGEIETGCFLLEARLFSSSDSSWRSPGFEQSPQHPVVCVRWATAVKYTKWLSRVSGEKYRLPTEQEWAFAAGLNNRFAVKRQGCSGNVADVAFKAVYKRKPSASCNDGAVHTAPISSLIEDRYGLNGFFGNTSEWLLDCWSKSPLPNTFLSVPAARKCDKHVARGGSWLSPPNRSGRDHRMSVKSKKAMNTLGFRVVREIRMLSVAP